MQREEPHPWMNADLMGRAVLLEVTTVKTGLES